MSSPYDLYQPGDSWLHRLDPRCKIAVVLALFVTLLTIRNLWLIAGTLALLQVLLVSAHIRRERLLWVWRMLLPTMVMIVLFWVLVYPDAEPFLRWGWLRLGPRTLAEGLAMALRIGALAFAVFFCLYATEQAALVHGLVSLGLPYAWGLTLAVALRYLPTMASTFRMISEAQQARGLELGRGHALRRARAYLPITVAMLITALRTAHNLAFALESRALGAVARRTYLRRLHFGLHDGLWTVGALVLCGVVLWARLVQGFGADALSLW